MRRQEDRLLERMEEAETHAAELKAAEAALKAGQAEVARERAADRRRARRDRARARAKHDAERATSPPRVSARRWRCSSMSRSIARGLAMSEARDGHCTQCHVRLRPQVYNEVRRNERSSSARAARASCTSFQSPAPPMLRPHASAPPKPTEPDRRTNVIRRLHRRRRPGQSRTCRLRCAHRSTRTARCIDELHGALGIATNNVAEYNGLLAALRWAVDHGQRDVHIRSDSELLVKQMRGEYKVKHPGLQPLVAQARLLVMRARHGRRSSTSAASMNTEADRLSNVAMDDAERRPAGSKR